MTATEYVRPPFAVLFARALHEAGHGVACAAFGVKVLALTLNDPEYNGGVCYFRHPAEGVQAPTLAQSSSPLLWPMETLSYFWRSYAVTCAGSIAVAVYSPAREHGFRRPRPD